MRKKYILVILILITFISYSQTNIFPNSGKVGIGTVNPSAKLSVNIGTGNASYPTVNSKGDMLISLRSSNNDFEFGNSSGYNDRKAWVLARHRDTILYGLYYSSLHIQPNIGDKDRYRGVGIGFNAYDEIPYGVHLAVNGSVGIGTINPGSWKLAVNGNIRAKEIKVEATGWSDFVFNKDYNLPTIDEVEKHIQENGHLKDIPSAKEVKENGVFLGEMDAKLLQKIEELTLYTIQQEKRIEKLEQKNQKLIEAVEILLAKKSKSE